jgi:hypothetical protein
MIVPPFILAICCLALIPLGVWVVFKAVSHPPRGGKAEIKLWGANLVLNGPAWLVMIVVGALITASPLIAGVVQKESQTQFQPPVQAQVVSRLDEPSYKDFRFLKDVSYLDLSNINVRPWYTYLPGWDRIVGHHTRIRPASLFNYMLVRKVGQADSIYIYYSTSGLLDLRCITHPYHVLKSYDSDQNVGEIIADVRSVPVGSEFTLATDVTYWNAFSVADKEDYTTYTHNQADEPEEMSMIIVFPDAKPFKRIEVEETPPGSDTTREIEGGFPGLGHQTFYWSYSKAAAGEWLYTTSWDW